LAQAHYAAARAGLYDWKITLDDDPVNMGTCTHETKTITLSKRWMTSEAEARDTVLHELAHARQLDHHGTAHASCMAELKRLLT
jgi:predicted metal-dependent hydrolase